MSSSEVDGSSDDGSAALILDDCGRVAVGGALNFRTRAFDSAVSVTKPADLKRLLADCTSVFTARATGVGEELSEGCTFWVPADATPKNALERLALEIFSFHARDATFDASKSGAEWWTQVIDPEDDIGLHWDRDYDLQEAQGLLLHPHIASVTYLNAPPEAAPTLVLECPSPLLESESPCGPISGAIACWPVSGRHLAFDGKKLHGAMSDLAAAASAASTSDASSASGKGKARAEPAPSAGKRVTFLVNIWLNHVPWGAEALPLSVTKGLGALPAVKLALGASSAPLPTTRLSASEMAAAKPMQSTFGEAKAKLVLELPWPTRLQAKSANNGRADGVAPPVLELAFSGDAELRPKLKKAKAPAKAPAAAKKRKER